MADSGNYVLAEQPHDAEQRRLALLSELGDSITMQRIRNLGLGDVRRVLEVGAGNGSIARKLAQAYGPNAKVTALDINPRFLTDLPENVEVVQGDILDVALKLEDYDLVHCRALLVHLTDPLTAVRKMVDALQPGGFLLVEEPDIICDKPLNSDHPASPAFSITSSTLCQSLRTSGHADFERARTLPALLSEALIDVNNDGHTRICRGGDRTAQFMESNFRIAGSIAVAQGKLDQSVLDATLEGLRDPDFSFLDTLILGVWGRKPLDSC